LEMNATADNIADGDIVALTCLLKCRASIQLRVHVTVDHPGADEIGKDTQRDINEIRSVFTVKVKSVKDSDIATLFGPLKCTVDFRDRSADVSVVFSTNPVEFVSDRTAKYPILSKCFISSFQFYVCVIVLNKFLNAVECCPRVLS